MAEEQPVPEAVQVHPGDIIQITDQGHPWFPSLLVVDEVRAWGVQAWAFVLHNDGTPTGHAFNRLRTGQFEVAGTPPLLPEDTAKARKASVETAATVARESSPAVPPVK